MICAGYWDVHSSQRPALARPCVLSLIKLLLNGPEVTIL
jgi:hypothetical protein